jgi:hypothetical protein
MKKIVLIFIIMALLIGCAAQPRPRIENNTYRNPIYDFSITLPKGWEKIETAPDWLKISMPWQVTRLTRLMLYNEKTSGFIAVSSMKTIGNAAKLLENKLENIIEKEYEKRKKEHSKNADIKQYSYTIHNTTIDDTPRLIGSEVLVNTFESTTFKATTRIFWYTCKEDSTCEVNFVLISDMKTFDENIEAYEGLVESLTKYGGSP